MLVSCPECSLQVSDKASFCPHCGYPFKPDIIRKRSTKKRRLPNGFGQITEIKGRNLRKPFRVMITVSKSETGRPICKLLQPEAYFATYNEAYQALMTYHKDPYKVDSNITMSELYELWKSSFKGAHAYFKTLKSGWGHCSQIYNTKVIDIRMRHIKGCLEDGIVIRNGEEKKASVNTQRIIKSLLSSMFDYAIEYEITDHNYAKDVNLSKVTENDTEVVHKTHVALTPSEIEYLWGLSDDPHAAMILIQCYTGMRPQEITIIERSKVNIKDWYMVGGIKTKNGKNRTIPIHEKIRPLIERFYAESENSKYLFPVHSYRMYHKYFQRILPNHYAHDPRKTFVTYAKKCGVDDFALKRIVGHAILDVTESVYTERSLSWLHEELQKIIM